MVSDRPEAGSLVVFRHSHIGRVTKMQRYLDSAIWKIQLINRNDQDITYDAVGNMFTRGNSQ